MFVIIKTTHSGDTYLMPGLYNARQQAEQRIEFLIKYHGGATFKVAELV